MSSQIYIFMPIGVITPVIIAWEGFCLQSAQCVNFVCNEGYVVQLLYGNCEQSLRRLGKFVRIIQNRLICNLGLESK